MSTGFPVNFMLSICGSLPNVEVRVEEEKNSGLKVSELQKLQEREGKTIQFETIRGDAGTLRRLPLSAL